jgi:3-hydroxybutyryl-CoA dehydrogenase
MQRQAAARGEMQSIRQGGLGDLRVEGTMGGLRVTRANSGQDIVDRAHAEGFRDLVMKPAEPDLLIARLVALLESPGTALPATLPQHAPRTAQSHAGRHALVVDDNPLNVELTVAMLANEAADAVNQGVCSESAADSAMRLGVNYPCGPLAWANSVGLAQVGTVLGHLAQTYGEDRYRTSPLIQHHVFAAKDLS